MTALSPAGGERIVKPDQEATIEFLRVTARLDRAQAFAACRLGRIASTVDGPGAGE